MGEPKFSSEKIIDIIFDDEISEILAEMENESKHCTVLSEKFGLSPKDLETKLSYLIEHNFVNQSGQGDDVTYSVDSEKLAESCNLVMIIKTSRMVLLKWIHFLTSSFSFFLFYHNNSNYHYSYHTN